MPTIKINNAVKKLLALASMLMVFTANVQIAKRMNPINVSSAILKDDGQVTVSDVMQTVDNIVIGNGGGELAEQASVPNYQNMVIVYENKGV